MNRFFLIMAILVIWDFGVFALDGQNTKELDSNRPCSPSVHIAAHDPNCARSQPSVLVQQTATQSGNTNSISVQANVTLVRVTENHWQVAINNAYFHGKLEVPVSTGRIDILTETQAIEVDKASKYAEGLAQALQYAAATNKKPVLAIYIDGERKSLEFFKQAEIECQKNNVELLLINNFVNVNELLALAIAGTNTMTTTAGSGQAVNGTAQNGPTFWLNSNSNIRHNPGCRYYKNTKNGRACDKSEGRPCTVCGG